MTLTDLAQVKAATATGQWRIAAVKHSRPRAGDPVSTPQPIAWTLEKRVIR